MYIGNHSRLSWCMETADADVDDVGDVDTDTEKDIDPDSGDANVDSEPEIINLPELEFTMNGTKDEGGEVDDEDQEVGDEDDIRMDDEDCDDDLEPQSKRKKTKWSSNASEHEIKVNLFCKKYSDLHRFILF